MAVGLAYGARISLLVGISSTCCAVGIGVLAQETSWQGTDNPGRFRVTLVAVQEGEGWRLAHVHIGPLQGPPGGAS